MKILSSNLHFTRNYCLSSLIMENLVWSSLCSPNDFSVSDPSFILPVRILTAKIIKTLCPIWRQSSMTLPSFIIWFSNFTVHHWKFVSVFCLNPHIPNLIMLRTLPAHDINTVCHGDKTVNWYNTTTPLYYQVLKTISRNGKVREGMIDWLRDLTTMCGYVLLTTYLLLNIPDERKSP